LLGCCSLAFFGNSYVATAQVAPDAKPAAMPTAPSPGKALICIYRTSRFTGSSAHDKLFVNGVFLAKLLNGEYACTEVSPGTVIITGMAKMYYGGIIQSSGAALNEATKKEIERVRLEVMADQTYYLKWTSGTMATGIKVTLEDASFGAKEMSKLHPSKPNAPDEKEEQK
jgi:hypothetical protein